MDASWVHAFTDSSTPSGSQQDTKAQELTVRSREGARVFHFPNGHAPLVAGAEDLVRAGNLEMSWVAKMVVTEAMNGWHTQESLDHAMTLCAELLPDPPDRIAARATHAFLGIAEPFPVWFNERVYRQELIHGKDYFTSDGTRFLPSDKGGTFEAEPYFSVETAKDLMMRARTPRGSSTRQYFTGVAKHENRCREMTPQSSQPVPDADRE